MEHPIVALENISPSLAPSVRAPLKNIKSLVHPHLFDFFFSFFFHTYLVWVAAIMKAVHHGLVPALHSAAEQAVQWSSGHWQASFLALKISDILTFHQSLSQWLEVGEETWSREICSGL